MPSAFASPGGWNTWKERMSVVAQSTDAGSTSRPLCAIRKPWRASADGLRESAGSNSLTLIESGTFQVGLKTTVSIRSEKIGVCVSTFPVITRSVWITSPLRISRNWNSGTLTIR